ncbi:MAG TPA: four-carbon acid sugar kinase family protein [Acetobacteraceae bacterium]|nr:four-carbon acid sugar kinase family protein [Acetobacteraceae bacterium]
MTLRLLADDLTGALDSAARFVPLVGPVPVQWRADDLPPTAAIDAGTRDLDAGVARAAMERLAPHLLGADIAFKKIDSLLRGHVAAELAACLRYFDQCVLAPAFPFQGRITRGGRQLARDGDRWRDSGVDLPAALRACGLTVPMRDAETDADLDAIVAAGRTLPGRVLWCGTGGLAGALAGSRVTPCPSLPRPILALIGSDHSVSAGQLAATGDRLHRIADPGTAELAAIRGSLQSGAAAVSVALPAGTPRVEATRRIGICFAAVLAAIERPGTLVVAGGETLRRLCDALGVAGLEVDGEVVPGVPTSLLRGGAWNGQRVVSKSGAFGDAGFVTRLLAR